MSLSPDRIKKDFPIFDRHPDLVYLDNAATTQKPASVIEAVSNYYSTVNSNVHRGVYRISEEATEQFEAARNKISRFIGSRTAKSIVFTRNTTEAINLLSYTLRRNLHKGDEILLTEMEHHSNLIPWYFLEGSGVKIKFTRMKDDFTLDMEDFGEKITKNTKIAAFTHVSNVLGTINDVREMSRICKEKGVTSIVDGAQSAPHLPVDVSAIGCDFFAFSGHKMLGPAGVGVLYGLPDLLEELPPFLGGGEMISDVSYSKATWAEPPWKFEAGTQNVEGAIGLSAALDYINSIGIGNVMNHEKEIIRYMMERLSEVPDLMQFGPPDPEKRLAVLSFNLGKVEPFRMTDALQGNNVSISHSVHPHDVASFLDRSGLAVRSGHHCAMPLMERMGTAATARASAYIYNGRSDVDLLVDAIIDCKKALAR